MLIPLRNRATAYIALIFMGGLFCSPIFAQLTIDLTDGICSERFLRSAEEVARSYADELGAPEPLPEMIDSSFFSEDYISAITFIYLAHFSDGVEETYTADLARVLFLAGCRRLPDSLFALHLLKNPKDFLAIGDYAVFLAQNWKFKKARNLIEENVKRFRGEKRNRLKEDLAMVHLSEYIETGRDRALEDAFEAFREARFGSKKPRTTMRKGIVEFKVRSVFSPETGKYRFNIAVEHAAGSDAVILGIKGMVDIGREMRTHLPVNSVFDVQDLFGCVYLAPGDKIKSKSGAFEIACDLGDFAPFYEGRVKLELEVIFPDGSISIFRHDPENLPAENPGFGHITGELYYGHGDWACSLMTPMADTGAVLPKWWKESARLSSIVEDSSRWEEGLRLVDSLMNVKLDPNLWVYKGVLMYLSGNPEDAVHPLMQAIESDPNNYWAVHDMALVQYDLGNLEEAARLFIETVKINPNIQEDNILAGVIFEELGDYELALKYYRIGSAQSAFRSDEVMSWKKLLEERLGISDPESD